MESAILELTRWLSREAEATLDLVDAGQLDEANRRIRAARKEVQGIREAIVRAMSELLKLQGEFIAVSGTT